MNNVDGYGSLRKYVEGFLEDCAARQLSESTLTMYRVNLQQFCAFIEGVDGGLTEGNVRSYFDAVQKEFKQTSAKAKISAASRFLDYLTIRQALAENPINRLKGEQKTEQRRQKAVGQATDAEKADFYAAMEVHPAWNLLTKKQKEEEFRSHKYLEQLLKEVDEIAKKLQLNPRWGAEQDN